MSFDLSYGGLPFYLPDATTLDKLERHIPWDDFPEFQSPDPNAHGWRLFSLGLPTPPKAPRWRLNQLFYPTGGTRWACFSGIMHADDVDQLAVGDSATFRMYDGTRTIETALVSLPPKPLFGIADAEDMYLVTLVDERYFWRFVEHEIPTEDLNAGYSWEDLFNDLATDLDISLDIPTEATNAAWGKVNPDSPFMQHFESIGSVLEGAAASVGCVVVRNLDGTYALRRHFACASKTKGEIARLIADANKLAGGQSATSDWLVEDNSRKPAMPDSWKVVFPKWITGHTYYKTDDDHRSQSDASYSDTFEIEGTLATLAGSVIDEGLVSQNPPALVRSSDAYNGTVILKCSAPALYKTSADAADIEGTPTNNSTLETLAKNLATNWYNWAFWNVDILASGMYDFDPLTGCDLLYRWQTESFSTRMAKPPINYGNVEYHNIPAVVAENTRDGLFFKVTSVSGSTAIGVPMVRSYSGSWSWVEASYKDLDNIQWNLLLPADSPRPLVDTVYFGWLTEQYEFSEGKHQYYYRLDCGGMSVRANTYDTLIQPAQPYHSIDYPPYITQYYNSLWFSDDFYIRRPSADSSYGILESTVANRQRDGIIGGDDYQWLGHATKCFNKIHSHAGLTIGDTVSILDPQYNTATSEYPPPVLSSVYYPNDTNYTGFMLYLGKAIYRNLTGGKNPDLPIWGYTTELYSSAPIRIHAHHLNDSYGSGSYAALSRTASLALGYSSAYYVSESGMTSAIPNSGSASGPVASLEDTVIHQHYINSDLNGGFQRNLFLGCGTRFGYEMPVDNTGNALINPNTFNYASNTGRPENVRFGFHCPAFAHHSLNVVPEKSTYTATLRVGYYAPETGGFTPSPELTLGAVLTIAKNSHLNCESSENQVQTGGGVGITKAAKLGFAFVNGWCVAAPNPAPIGIVDGGTGSSLTSPGADRLMFWDESANAVAWLEAGSGLSISGTTISATGGGSGGIPVASWMGF